VGENYDGNSFYKEAIKKGANCVILNESYFDKQKVEEKIPVLLVKDTLECLNVLAQYKRKHVETYFIGVTGSVGKTSTRDMIYSVLSRKYSTLRNEKNYNNQIGVPLTMLKVQKEEMAVVEMGMNQLGEIERLSKIVRPQIGVITNIGTAHIGKLGSRENICKAKLEITTGMDKDGILILNQDDDLLHAYYEKNRNNRKMITIGIKEESDFGAKNIVLMEDSTTFTVTFYNQEYDVYVPIPGLAFVYNALVSIAVGTLLKMDMETILEGIKNASITKKRLEIVKRENYTIINDSYNASEDSMKASLQVLASRNEKRKIAVLGDMLELGEFSEKIHRTIGESVAMANIDLLITVGQDSKYIAVSAKENGMDKKKIYSFHENKEVIYFLKKELKDGDVLLFKASNRLNLSEIVEKL
jgi:UDP-N-acetylmuramoyl-tripeptide--D-alanyl-D-alanine ligase